jgi:hypothetical protein
MRCVMRFLLLTWSLVVAGCGSENGDAVAPIGTWRLVSETIGGNAVLEVDGWLEVTSDQLAYGQGKPAAEGLIASYTLAGATLALSTGASVPFTLENPRRLRLELEPQRVLVLEEATSTPRDELMVVGTVSLASGAPAMVMPRVALIFLPPRDSADTFVNDPRDDKPLSLAGGAGTFDLSRDRAALGIERITFGQGAAISVGFVVVYDDRDGSGTLHDLFEACSPTTTDCVRGIAPFLLGYRGGMSPELAASPYGFLRSGWSHAFLATDRRTSASRTGLLSSDPSRTIRYDLIVPVDPASVIIPVLPL